MKTQKIRKSVKLKHMNRYLTQAEYEEIQNYKKSCNLQDFLSRSIIDLDEVPRKVFAQNLPDYP